MVAQQGPCQEPARCVLEPYDVTVEIVHQDARFSRAKFPNETKLIEVGETKRRWKISGTESNQPFNGQYTLVVCVQGNLGERETLSIVKPAVGVGISGSAPCGEDY